MYCRLHSISLLNKAFSNLHSGSVKQKKLWSLNQLKCSIVLQPDCRIAIMVFILGEFERQQGGNRTETERKVGKRDRKVRKERYAPFTGTHTTFLVQKTPLPSNEMDELQVQQCDTKKPVVHLGTYCTYSSMYCTQSY